MSSRGSSPQAARSKPGKTCLARRRHRSAPPSSPAASPSARLAPLLPSKLSLPHNRTHCLIIFPAFATHGKPLASGVQLASLKRFDHKISFSHPQNRCSNSLDPSQSRRLTQDSSELCDCNLYSPKTHHLANFLNGFRSVDTVVGRINVL